ncbi:MAG TPA: hypothetical protein DHN29_20380 [Cytophagales bacterium]|nr:hypothetical protein [Cytophagales bacterium]|tara:strand:+ start:659 stop:1009 length:351 start_codon:yes stop_codon:yes gene_type:complete
MKLYRKIHYQEGQVRDVFNPDKPNPDSFWGHVPSLDDIVMDIQEGENGRVVLLGKEKRTIILPPTANTVHPGDRVKLYTRNANNYGVEQIHADGMQIYRDEQLIAQDVYSSDCKFE